MAYIAIGCALLALLVWASGGGRNPLKRREWRLLAGAFALAAFSGAAFVTARGGWGKGLVLVVLGLWLLTATRVPPARRDAPSAPPVREMTAAEARSILGVGPDADRAQIQAAYTRLMRMAHPDKGGTAGLAAQLNAARDRLLGRSRS